MMRFKQVLVAGALASVAMTAWAQGGHGDHGRAGGLPGMGGPGEYAMGPGMLGLGPDGGPGGPGGHRHGHRGGHGAMDPERVNARIDRMTERLAKAVEATPEQREKIGAIAKAAAADLSTLRKQGGDLRRQAMDLLKAPTVDRAAIESLRSQQMTVADALSKRMTTALADTAEVLSPEQRAKLAERFERRGPRGPKRG